MNPNGAAQDVPSEVEGGIGTGRMKHLPHLNHLRSFEAAARTLSFTAAAAELACTQSAVSAHVRSLEAFIGRPLFVRYPRSLGLTSLGEAYLPSVRHALSQVDAATEAIMAPRRGGRVVVSCPVTLAATWLAGRVAAFRAGHPEVEVTIDGRIWRDEEQEVADIRIASIHRDEISPTAIRLWQDRLAVLARPGLEVAGAPLERPEQLRGAHLIHHLGRPDYWAAVGRHFGLDPLATSGGTQTNSLNVAMELAAGGHGVTVVPRAVAATHLARGLLVAPFGDAVESPWAAVLSDESLATTREARALHRFLADGAEG